MTLQVCDEIEHLMDDDGDMAEMYLTEKKQRKEAYVGSDMYDQPDIMDGTKMTSKSAPVSPVGSISGTQKLQRAYSSMSSSKHGSLMDSSGGGENIDQLEMLLEAYFVFSDNTLNKLISVRQFQFKMHPRVLNFVSVLKLPMYYVIIFPVFLYNLSLVLKTC